jgi:hypothetical protein
MELIALKQFVTHVLSKQHVVKQIVRFWTVVVECVFNQIVVRQILRVHLYVIQHVSSQIVAVHYVQKRNVTLVLKNHHVVNLTVLLLTVHHLQNAQQQTAQILHLIPAQLLLTYSIQITHANQTLFVESVCKELYI